MKNQKVFVAFFIRAFAFCALFVILAASTGAQTYTYTGKILIPEVNTSVGTLTCPPICNITGSFTLSKPLPGNVTGLDLVPAGGFCPYLSCVFTLESFTFTDGLNTVTSANALGCCIGVGFGGTGITVSTDSQGNISNWRITMVAPASTAVVFNGFPPGKLASFETRHDPFTTCGNCQPEPLFYDTDAYFQDASESTVVVGDFSSSAGSWTGGSAGPPPLQITTASLPRGQVGVNYDSGPLSATGGTPFPSASFPDPYTWSATNLPAGLNISYFAGDIYGLSPATAGSFFPAVTVTDFNGNTATKSFVIPISPPQTKSRYTPVEKAYYALLGEHYMWFGDYYGYLAKECKLVAPEAEELCVGVDALSFVYTELGLDYEAKAADPADTNYTVIAIPSPPSINIPAPGPSWTSAQVAAFNSLKTYIVTLEQIIGLSEAEITSVNRAEGAYEAGNSYWEQQQVAALNQYTYLEALDLQLLLAQNTQLQTAYSQSGFPNFSVSVAEMTQFELGIAANGLPSDLQQQLTALGVDSQGLGFLQKALSSFNPSNVTGDITQTFVPSTTAATMIQQLAASFITNGVSVVPAPPSGTACNGVYSGTFNGNISISRGQTCTFIGGGITGNVHMTGGSLALSNAVVGGDVQIDGGGVFTIGPSTTIHGDLQVQNIPFGSGLNVIYGANVEGNLQFENNAASVEIGLPPSFPPNVIGGDLQVQNNSASTQIYNNTVAGNLQVGTNTVSTQVFGNSVTNNLQCQNNKSITGGGNTAAKKQGQCSSF